MATSKKRAPKKKPPSRAAGDVNINITTPDKDAPETTKPTKARTVPFAAQWEFDGDDDNEAAEKLALLDQMMQDGAPNEWSWRVQRTRPKHYKGVQTSGVVGYIDFEGGPPDDEEIRNCWGGGHYVTRLMDGSKRNLSYNGRGMSFLLDIPGRPFVEAEEPPPPPPQPQQRAGNDMSAIVEMMKAQNDSMLKFMQNQVSTQMEMVKAFVLPMMAGKQGSPDVLKLLEQGADLVDALSDSGILSAMAGKQGDSDPTTKVLEALLEFAKQRVDSRQETAENPGREVKLQPSGDLPPGSTEIPMDEKSGQ